MKGYTGSISFDDIHVRPLAERKNLIYLEQQIKNPESPAPGCSDELMLLIDECASLIVSARKQGFPVLLMFGAHLIRNGAGLIINNLIEGGFISHIAGNGACAIHDWEFAYQGMTTESVKDNVRLGDFGTWDDTGRTFALALLSGGIKGTGFGDAIGQCIATDGIDVPSASKLEEDIRNAPGSQISGAEADLLYAIKKFGIREGRVQINHPWKNYSVFGCAWSKGIPVTVHPGLGYDIFTLHPMYSGAAVGRAAAIDFLKIVETIIRLDGGVVISIGSAIMAPQVFEKAVSFANNIRRSQNKGPLKDFSIFVVDIQPASWDWTRGEPPKSNPAYFLRFCKSFSRMGGLMKYVCLDNVVFMHNLYHAIKKK